MMREPFKARLFAFLPVTFALCTACKTSTPQPASTPGTTDVTEPSVTSPAVSGALTPEVTRAVLVGLGCPEASITPTGCMVCPSYGGVPRDTQMVELDDEEIAVTISQGVFSEEPGAQVLASFDGCQERGAGVYRVTEMVHLVQENDGAWAPRSATILDDLRECRQIARAGQQQMTVCDMLSGRMGEYIGEHVALLWSMPEDIGEPIASPTRQGLLVGSYVESCAENLALSYGVELEPVDVDGDGLIDIVLEVTTREGGFDGPLDECVDGEFEEPLTPEREDRTDTYTFTYLASPDGYREASGAEGQVRYSEAFEQY